MKKYLLTLMCLLLLCGNIFSTPTKQASETISFFLNQPVDSTYGIERVPDSAHILTYADNATAATFTTRSTTYPFSAIGIDTIKTYGDTTYVFADQIQDIDGTGGNFVLAVEIKLFTGGYSTSTRYEVQIVSDSLENFLDASKDSSSSAAAIAKASQDSAKYAGAVWVNGSLSNTNTSIPNGDGTEGNPVSTLIAARTIADNLGIKKYNIINSSSLTLAATHEDWIFNGLSHNSTLDLGSQDVDNSSFHGMTMTGTMGGTGSIYLSECEIENLHDFDGKAVFSWLTDSLVMDNNSEAFLGNCYSAVVGNLTPTLDFNIASNDVVFRNYSGSIAIEGMSDNDGFSYDGNGQIVVNNTSTNAPITARGNLTITDNGSGTVFTRDAALNGEYLKGEFIDSMNLAIPNVNVTSMDASVITSTVIATDAIGASEMAANSIGASEIALDAIGASEMAIGAITAQVIADGAIDFATFSGTTPTAWWYENFPTNFPDLSIKPTTGEVISDFDNSTGTISDAQMDVVGVNVVQIVGQTDSPTNLDNMMDGGNDYILAIQSLDVRNSVGSAIIGISSAVSSHGMYLEASQAGNGLFAVNTTGTGGGARFQASINNGSGLTVIGSGIGRDIFLGGDGFMSSSSDTAQMRGDSLINQGSGGSAPTVEQIDAELTANHGVGVWTSSTGGNGLYNVAIVCVDTVNTDTLPAVAVAIKTSTGTDYAGPQASESDGYTPDFSIDAGTYYTVANRIGYTFPNKPFTISGLDTIYVAGGPANTTTLGTGNLCTVNGYVTDIDGVVSENAVVTFELPNKTVNTCDEVIFGRFSRFTTTNASGYFELPLYFSSCVDNSTYTMTVQMRGGKSRTIRITVPDAATYEVSF